ncbi:Uncharacterised protein [Bordetella pertussis]|nr:Uncharacterised protein [Bordetella pertussis]CFO34484.1 Uncharacterised protein [Bordetella pertussis]CFW10342.1 Uncharacterised protein [Bordetella pertussis]CPJ82082.1 Uncharacterised protein [Bordetella pertussis]CPQ03288.1 Uncharacterised protein [Bordetella pertussis]
MPPTHRMVINAMLASKPDEPMAPLAAIGARFRPITATTAPVTTGGIMASIQRAPLPRALAAHTTRPISAYTRPQAMIAPSATPILALAPGAT